MFFLEGPRQLGWIISASRCFNPPQIKKLYALDRRLSPFVFLFLLSPKYLNDNNKDKISPKNICIFHLLHRSRIRFKMKLIHDKGHFFTWQLRSLHNELVVLLYRIYIRILRRHYFNEGLQHITEHCWAITVAQFSREGFFSCHNLLFLLFNKWLKKNNDEVFKKIIESNIISTIESYICTNGHQSQ